MRLEKGEPTDVAPMAVELHDNSKPIKAAQRRCPPLKRVVSKLLEMGFLKLVPESDCISAPSVVPKAPPAFYRLTVDLRATNAATKFMTWPMPSIDSERCHLSTSMFFVSIDYVSGYWQLPLKLHTFMTTKECGMPTRALQGA